MDIKEIKKALRKEISTLKRGYTPEEKLKMSRAILEQLEQLEEFKRANTILLYYSLPDEVQTAEFIEKWCSSKRIVLPVVCGEDLELREYHPEAIEVGYQSILEPLGSTKVDPSEIELAVIPGVAFDLKFNRLGRGKGFYDRILPNISAHKIGLAYHFQIVDSVPTEEFDKSLDLVLYDEFSEQSK